ncbi:Fe-S-containing protein [Afifella sp. IM 167]|uniref:Fe-S-containing protein n=1 Tax=Afifella sp. IM 167 TaxID=2033586 RepID=UPI001CCD8FB5|nr:Fe-S-containing protein [Afifella sp. IM 167]MBZ8131914.1 hypothetical protein [Afifella sp. IM 167]
MSFYLADGFRAFAPATFLLALLAGLIVAVADRRGRSEGLAARLSLIAAFGLLAGSAAGVTAYAWSGEAASVTEIRMFAEATALGAALLALLAAFALRFAGAVLLGQLVFALFSLVLFAQAGIAFSDAVTAHSLTATSVLNTELILNVFAIALTAFALAGLAAATSHVARRLPLAALLTFVLAIVVEALVWAGDVTLGLLQVGWLEVTSGRVSLVAKADYYSDAAIYAELVLGLALAALFLMRSPPARRLSEETAGSARTEGRKALAFSLGERRWFRGLAASLAFVAGSMLYYDLYAAQPPALSPAEPVEVAADGYLRIPVETVSDGTLHRFAYVTSDGHRVRFFLINRFDADHVAIGVVFDACMICGDDGYIQRGNEIICIACNVRIFQPSIGKPGGCNPIPMKHAVEDGRIVIAKAELEKGSRLFTELVEIEVADPVTGETLINTRAPYSTEFEGRTYYFSGRDSYDTFRADPQKFAAEPLAPAAVHWDPEV